MNIDADQARAELQHIVEQNLECAVQLSELLQEERTALEEQRTEHLAAFVVYRHHAAHGRTNCRTNGESF